MIKLNIYYIITYYLKLYKLTNIITLYKLKNIQIITNHYNIQKIYNFTNKTTPIIFISPFPTNNIKTTNNTNNKHIQYQQPIQNFTLKKKIFSNYNK